MEIDVISISGTGRTSFLADSIAFGGRIVIGAMFVYSAVSIIAVPDRMMRLAEMAGMPIPALSVALLTIVEFVGGIALAAGYHVRLAAGALSMLIACATILVLAFNAPERGDQALHLLTSIALVGGLVQISAFGGGVFSLDHFGYGQGD